MILFPAIDLKDGNVVRLLKGDFDQQTIYGDKPEDQGKLFQDQGFKFLHIVDLDGAKTGTQANKKAIKAILNEVDIPLQIGGGIRSMQDIESWINIGVKRVILGTAAVRNPDLVKQACREFPNNIVVGMDARGEHIAIEGWVETSEHTIYDFAKSFENAGASALLYTDIDRDGTGTGPNIQMLQNLAETVTTPVIASGGVGAIEDIQALKDIEHLGIEGAIIGRALYEHKIAPKDALKIAG